MLPLYLLAAHMVGDYLLQSRWQSARKLDDRAARALHVLHYTLAFIPVAALAASTAWHALAFLALLAALHYLTDSRRFLSNPGDWLEWALMSDRQKINDYERTFPHLTLGAIRVRHKTADGLKLRPNPWEPLPLMVDQTLHVIQIAVLGGWLLA